METRIASTNRKEERILRLHILQILNFIETNEHSVFFPSTTQQYSISNLKKKERLRVLGVFWAALIDMPSDGMQLTTNEILAFLCVKVAPRMQ